MTKSYKATLVRGETYYLGPKRFERNIGQPVTEEEMKKLKARAVDRLTTTSADSKEVTIRQKFKFEEVVGAPAKGKADKLAELAAMQGSGGIEFEEEDAAEGEEAEAEEEGDDTGEEEAAAPVPARPKSVSKPRRR